MIRPWPVLDTIELATTPIFRLIRRRCASVRTGLTHNFFVLESPDWINVIPIRQDEQVIMVRQYRHGRGATSLEIPGGMVDPTDSSPLEAARRELIEETGYRAGRIEALGSIAPNPAIHNNLCHSFIATDLERMPDMDTARDGAEEIEVVSVPLRRVPELIRKGEITHALVVVAFSFLFGLDGG